MKHATPKTWKAGEIIWIDRYPKMVKEFFTSPDGILIKKD